MTLREQLEEKLTSVDSETIDVLEELMEFQIRNVQEEILPKEMAINGIANVCSCLHKLKRISLREQHYVKQIAEELY